MPKKNLLISAALTAFILVVVTGIASAYQRVNSSLDIVKAETAEAARMDNGLPAANQTIVTHQEAALVAANYLGQTDLYSVENIVWEGMDAYQVVFSSGDTVYVSMTGDILSTEVPEPVVVIEEVPSSTTNSGNTNARSSSSSTAISSNNTSSSSSYSDDDHHEEDHEEDHEEEHEDD